MRCRVGWGTALVVLLGTPVTHVQAQATHDLEFKKVERLHLDDVHPGPEGERAVDVYLRALTRFGVPVKGIRPADIEVWQDRDRIDPSDVTLEPFHKTGRGAALVLCMDASGTMRGEPFRRAKEVEA